MEPKVLTMRDERGKRIWGTRDTNGNLVWHENYYAAMGAYYKLTRHKNRKQKLIRDFSLLKR